MTERLDAEVCNGLSYPEGNHQPAKDLVKDVHACSCPLERVAERTGIACGMTCVNTCWMPSSECRMPKPGPQRRLSLRRTSVPYGTGSGSCAPLFPLSLFTTRGSLGPVFFAIQDISFLQKRYREYAQNTQQRQEDENITKVIRFVGKRHYQVAGNERRNKRPELSKAI